MFTDNPDFFPTPAKVALKMLARVSKDATNFLEPSAGKGDIADIIKRKGGDDRHSRHKIDCIEIEPDLVAALRGKEHTIVGHDWLTYSGVSFYDAVVMNPPFSNGAAHLLKAWEFLWDGEIVCLLNEETVKNPHTKERQRLAEIIKDHGDVTYLEDCFSSAQRKTDVKVAMVYLRKKSEEEDLNDLWKKDGKEKAVDDSAGADAMETMLAIPDLLGNLEHYYNMASEHMQKAFNHIRKSQLYMSAGEFRSRDYSSDRRDSDIKDIMNIALSNVNHARAEWGPMIRRAAWMSVFDKMQFHKWLDSKQRDQFLRDVQRDANIPFTADNIRGTLENVISQRKRLFEQSCANVFDALTDNYFENGKHEGWKTNDNFKVNEKLIFPYGVRYESKYKSLNPWGTNYSGEAERIYADLDRILCVLNGERFEKCYTVGAALSRQFEYLHRHPGHSTSDQTCESQHFEIRFFKKGTVHLKFQDRKLWERFNAAAAAGKLWLGMNSNGREEFPGRRTRYRHGKEVEIKDPPMPADPMALINELRAEYGAADPTPVAAPQTPAIASPADSKIAANAARIAELEALIEAQQQEMFS